MDVWEKKIKVQEPQCGKQELGHSCGHCSPCPRTVQWGSRQMGSLVCLHRKKQRELWAHKALATAVPRELETLDCGCKNQDFINRGRRRENGHIPKPSTVIRGIFLKSMSGKVQKIWSSLAKQQILCGMSLNVQERERSCLLWNANAIFNQEFVPLGGGSCQHHFSFCALCSPTHLFDLLTFWMPRYSKLCYSKIKDFWPL